MDAQKLEFIDWSITRTLSLTDSSLNSLKEKILEEDSYWMSRALELAAQAGRDGETPVGCIIVRDKKILSEAGNSKESTFDPTAHAEIIALRSAALKSNAWRLSDCTLYVTLEPCFMCAGAIIHARIPHVVFATFDPKAGAAGSLANVLEDARLNHRCSVTTGIKAAESSTLLKNFFKLRRTGTGGLSKA